MQEAGATTPEEQALTVLRIAGGRQSTSRAFDDERRISSTKSSWLITETSGPVPESPDFFLLCHSILNRP